MIFINLAKKESGQILIETMVALTMVTIGLLGMLNLLSSSIGLNKVVSDQYVASYLASEGIEIVKNIIDNNVAVPDSYNIGLSTEGNYLVDYNSDALLTYDDKALWFDGGGTMKYTYNPIFNANASLTPFKRVINISYEGEDLMLVKSTVTWTTRGGGNFNVALEDHFYNWR
jgi:hypothetical protein